MRSVIISLLFTVRASVRDRAALQLEILALRHQLHAAGAASIGSTNGVFSRDSLPGIVRQSGFGIIIARPALTETKDERDSE
jgi:hypothetical protein